MQIIRTTANPALALKNALNTTRKVVISGDDIDRQRDSLDGLTAFGDHITAVGSLRDIAREQDAQFVLLAGDMFDKMIYIYIYLSYFTDVHLRPRDRPERENLAKRATTERPTTEK